MELLSVGVEDVKLKIDEAIRKKETERRDDECVVREKLSMPLFLTDKEDEEDQLILQKLLEEIDFDIDLC